MTCQVAIVNISNCAGDNIAVRRGNNSAKVITPGEYEIFTVNYPNEAIEFAAQYKDDFVCYYKEYDGKKLCVTPEVKVVWKPRSNAEVTGGVEVK